MSLNQIIRMNRTIHNEQPKRWNGLKVFVYGKRYHSVEGGRIRYVNDWQVSPAEKWDEKKT